MVQFTDLISAAGYAIETVGVMIILIGSSVSAWAYARSLFQSQSKFEFIDFRRKLGRSVILGLEFLIAGDIIRTVIVAESLENVLILGLIILIRSFLTVTLHLEIEGHWPWQPPPDRDR
ncbi:MAG: DUF1622 domain-containing protein [Gammaproteobacteria bacterium]